MNISERSKEQNPLEILIARPLGYPVEAHEAIEMCMNESPRMVFRYGDEQDCHFTIRDELERSQYANFSSLYKSMEEFLLRHTRRKGKRKRRSRNTESIFDTIEVVPTQNKDERLSSSSKTMEVNDESELSTSRFHFVGIGDNISQLLETQQQQEAPAARNIGAASECSTGVSGSPVLLYLLFLPTSMWEENVSVVVSPYEATPLSLKGGC
ncbi:hypothetical protein Y032_0015g2648 [Ancylostoma ceylanicum]|uniref:Uncharacterized protein n=1 Tax=Ancylostoma ceylanicum TaxID=53326 RepID=A0A016V9N5_9BILA|nr:hypothetical protein Y032_0015g2648 [Ancylostoma ceylanicum]